MGQPPLHVMMLGLRAISGAQGGVETHVAHLARALVARGVQVTVLTRRPYCAGTGDAGAGDAGAGNVGTGLQGAGDAGLGAALRVVPLPCPRGASLEALGHSLLGVIHAARHRPDILHIHAVGPSVVIPLARLAGLRVVATHHGKDYAREKWGPLARGVLRAGEAMQRHLAQGRIVISAALQAELAARDPAHPYQFIPNGVPARAPTPQTGALRDWGLVPGRYVLNVGRIVPEKRQLDLLRAFRAASLPPEARLVLAGAADHASAYAQALQAEIGQDPRILCPGFVSGAPLHQLFSHAGLFALPSSHEGLPIALIEALQAGCAVLASDIAGTRELGLPEACYVAVGDRAAMAARITQAMAAPPDAALDTPPDAPPDTPPAGRLDWSGHLAPYDWDKIGAATLALYRGL